MQVSESPASVARREEAVRAVAIYLRSETDVDEVGAEAEARDALHEATRLAAGVIDLGTRRWWVLTLRGVIALAAGLLAVFRPLTAAAAVVLFFGAWIFIDGFMALIASVSGRSVWQFVLAGALGVGIGVLVLTVPQFSLALFYVLTAAWAIARGISEIVLGARLRHHAGGQVALIALGVLSCLVGLALLFVPLPGLIVLGFWFGVYAIAHGLLFIVLSMQLRGAGKRFALRSSNA
jgi:uncharacterized membrane protein HdeD (DUF308 family)